jgi:RNA polymerase sigma-70 factor (ECF subfamily)
MTAPDTAAVRAAVEAIRRGDGEAFSEIVECYERRLFALSLMMTRSPSGADEVTQDAFVRAYTHLDQYDATRPFYPWLATIAVRLAQTWLRRRLQQESREGTALDPDTSQVSGVDALTALIENARDRRLWQAVAALPSGERTAVYLHYRQEMSVSDAAHALGVTSGTVKTLLFRARRRLRPALAASGYARHQEERS